MQRRYGILSNPVGHSLSPILHNAAFQELGINAVYERFEKDLEELPDFFANLERENVAGLSVSLPYKMEVMKYLDDISDEAEAIGAVNTVSIQDGQLFGSNTDAIGALESIKSHFQDLRDKRIVVIGAGGAARAIVFGLLDAGAKVIVQNRNLAKARELEAEFDESFKAKMSVEEWGQIPGGDVLLHTTSMWLNPDINEIPFFCFKEYLQNFSLVMDISYNVKTPGIEDPLETPLTLLARKLGITVITGDDMLVRQAAKQFEIWTGKEAPLQVMKDALISVLSSDKK